jgi:hypothetical protein
MAEVFLAVALFFSAWSVVDAIHRGADPLGTIAVSVASFVVAFYAVSIIKHLI